VRCGVADVLPTRVRAGQGLPVLFRSSCTDTWLDLGLDGWRDTHAEFVLGSSSTAKRGKNYFKTALTTAGASAVASKRELPRQDGPRVPLTPFHLSLSVSYCGDFIL
jgi:hypothetical protein